MTYWRAMMIKLTTEQVEQLCDRCRYPMTVSGDDLEALCDKCPLTVAERMEQIERECEA